MVDLARRFHVLTVLVLLFGAISRGIRAEDKPRLRLDISDSQGQLLPCRIHLTDAAGQPVLAPPLPAWKDHFVCDGRADVPAMPGRFHYEIERGPEYESVAGDVEVEAGKPQTVAVTLKRIADLKALGWYGGDLHVHRKPEDVPLLMQAEDLHIAQVITWWNVNNPWKEGVPSDPLRTIDGDRFLHVLAGEDERGGGALLYYHLKRPIDITAAKREYPAAISFLDEARKVEPECWVDVEKPFWWDVPAWLASGKVDSIGIANNHMCRSQMYADEAWGRPRDAERLPAPLGNGRWTQEIYYHALNCGLRIPPSAGSASGVLPNPVGYNRVYVHTGGPLDYEKWWANLKAGRCFVTNGPLLMVRAAGELPGHVFVKGSPERIPIEINLISRDRVPAVEIIQNGEVVETLRCADDVEQRLTTELAISENGWFLVRAVTDNPRTFRFASTGPYYVDGGGSSRISRRSAEFFQTWVEERVKRLEEALRDADQRRAVVDGWQVARDFWREKAQAAKIP
jgi:hypothetical protein